MFPDIHKYDAIALDTETTGLNYPVDKAFGVSLATPNESFYWDIRIEPHMIEVMNEEFKKYRGVIASHNGSFDYKMSLGAGIQIPIDKLRCTIIRACCINEHEISYSLEALAQKYLGVGKTEEIYKELAALFGGPATKNVQMRNIAKAPAEIVAPYAERDAELALRLYRWQEEEIKRQRIEKIISFEESKLPLFIETEVRGIRVDLDATHRAIQAIDPLIFDAQLQLNDAVGFNINVNSPKDVKKAFNPKKDKEGNWITQEGFPLPATPAGNPSIGKEVLHAMGTPISKGIVEVRSRIKTRDTFLKGHILGSAHGGRVYPSIHQCKGEDGGTQTGRLSYSGPALQQIPSRNKTIAEVVKKCFLPEEGQVWMDADMASFEVRMFAHLVSSMNDTVAKAYAKDPTMDLHQWVGDLMDIPRNPPAGGGVGAKTLNLAMIFCMSDGTVAKNLGLPYTEETFLSQRDGKVITYNKAGYEAQDLIASYHRNVPGVKDLAEKCRKLAKVNGYLETISGRRLRFPNPNEVYKASAVYVQSNAADVNKQNWTRVSEALGSDGVLLLNTHDSYSMSVSENWGPVWERVREALQEDRGLNVPLIADLNGVGSTWWDALQGV